MTSTADQNELRFLKRNPPRVDEDVVSAAVEAHYGLRGHLTPLGSERDQNFLVEDGPERILFKISNAAESRDVIDFQTQALRHIHDVTPGIAVPQPIRTTTGAELGTLNHRGVEHFVRALTFLDGDVAGETGADGPALRRSTGVALAGLDDALAGFFHPAADQDHPWDVKRAGRLAPQLRHIEDDALRDELAAILQVFETRVAPRLPSMRQQVIHQDAHTHNLVVASDDPMEVTGIIDFGDMVFGPLAAELAVAAYLSWRDDWDPLGVVDLLVGYDSLVSLRREEIEVLYDMVLARMAIGLLIPAARAAVEPEESGFEDEFSIVGHRIMEVVRRRDEVEPQWFRALGFTASSGTSRLRARRSTVLGSYSPHFYAEPVHLVSGRGLTLRDASGAEYLDFYNNVPTLGHAHRSVVNAVSRQMSVLNINSRYLYESIVDYAEALTASLGLETCLFVNSGSEANDVAVQIAGHLTEREKMLTLKGSYHGVTTATSPTGPVLGSGQLIPAPDSYRRVAIDVGEIAHLTRQVLDSPDAGFAGFIFDPAMTSNGIPDVPAGWVSAVAGEVRDAGGLVIADEVQTGFGRTGAMWGHLVHDVQPDIVTIGKPAGNGHPLGAVITTKAILDRFMEERRLFSTFGGNPVSAAAGLAVLGTTERDGLVQHADAMGRYLKQRLAALDHPRIGDVRGSGLLLAVELVSDRASKTPLLDGIRPLLERMREGGVLVGSAGGAGTTLKIRPPLVVSESEIDRFVAALTSSL